MADMADNDLMYVVRSWYDPEKGKPYLEWLENKHMREVLREPGILWARRAMLDQPDDNGWPSCLLIYGFKDRDALAAYMESDARTGFWEELQTMKDIHYSDRYWGDVDVKLESN